jgi:hypothetical protein
VQFYLPLVDRRPSKLNDLHYPVIPFANDSYILLASGRFVVTTAAMVLDENLPTYRFKTSSEDPLASLLYYTHKGSEPSADYLIKRPPPSQSHNQYALGIFDVQYASVLYGEALIRPDWTQPTLSAAEVRANGGTHVSVPLTPSAFSISLYNPDQTVVVKHVNSSWSKDSWEFEIPEKSFKLPSTSKIDQDAPDPVVADLIPKVNFRWKRDSRVSRDMTCYMSGKTVGGQKSKEPDITVALFKGGKSDAAVAIYEPNMARVEVEDRKGLEVVLLLSAEIIRDLYLAPRHDPFNTSGAPPPNRAGRSGSSPNQPLTKQPTIPVAGAAAMSGGLNNTKPLSSHPHSSSARGTTDHKQQADIDAEKRRMQAIVEQEKEKAREREARDREEQERIRQMLEREEREEQERRRREVEEETERLRRQYGVQQEESGRQPRSPPSPNLPPRPGGGGGGAVMSGGGAGWFGPPDSRPPKPPRPQSVGPPVASSSSSNHDHVYSQNQSNQQGGRRAKFGQFLQSSPYAGPATATVSGFFGNSSGGGNGHNSKEEEKKKKIKKKRSVHF